MGIQTLFKVFTFFLGVITFLAGFAFLFFTGSYFTFSQIPVQYMGASLLAVLLGAMLVYRASLMKQERHERGSMLISIIIVIPALIITTGFAVIYSDLSVSFDNNIYDVPAGVFATENDRLVVPGNVIRIDSGTYNVPVAYYHLGATTETTPVVASCAPDALQERFQIESATTESNQNTVLYLSLYADDTLPKGKYICSVQVNDLSGQITLEKV